MCDPARMETYQASWAQVQQAYSSGFMVSERNFQAVLYGVLQANLPGVHVVVEPTWEMAGRRVCRPDLVLAEGGEITDIFELKFVPEGWALYEDDIAKLQDYVGNPGYPIQLNPRTGQWTNPLPLRVGCCLHFVAIAQHAAQAVWPPLPGGDGINQWFGRVGGDEMWGIHFA